MKTTQPISQHLADKFGGKWKAVKWGFSYIYECDDGREARPYIFSDEWEDWCTTYCLCGDKVVDALDGMNRLNEVAQ